MQKAPLLRPDLRPDLAKIYHEVLQLRRLTRNTGFKTTRSQGELLARLSADDLVVVAEALNASGE
jgi:hypothetical protein